MNKDPREVIAGSPMSRLQITIVGITIALNALDGFDVLSISFASPGITEEWGVTQAQLGFVLAMELLGMAVGSVLLGGVADKIGRKPTLLGCLIVMAVGMLLATVATGIVDLSIYRIITGLGIGGLLAAITATAAEFSNAKRKHLCISLMAIGYPLGAVIGGAIAGVLLQYFDWRSVFYLGAIATALFIPVVYFVVPESVHWLARKQPDGALDKINRTMKRLGHATITAVPVITETARKRSVADIFAPRLIATTVLVTLAYFFHITTFYFIAKWTPQIVADMGFPAAQAGGVLVWLNVGGALGGAVFGLLTLRYGLKALTIGVMLLSAVMVTVFGTSPPDLNRLSLLAAFAGFGANAGIVGMYAIFAHAFPTHVRATGTGFAIGVGRGGSVLAPIIAGFLFQAGFQLSTVALVMALGSLAAAVMIFFLKLKPDEPSEEGTKEAVEEAMEAGMKPSPARS